MLDIPLWNEWGFLGLSLGMNLFVAVEFIRGTWTTRKNLEQAQKVTETFKSAWETSEKKWEALGPVINNVVVATETILHILQSAPRPPDHHGGDEK